MSLQTVEEPHGPAGGATLVRFLTSAITFGMIVILAGWVLLGPRSPRRTPAPTGAEQAAPPPMAVTMGPEQGGLAELWDDLGRARPTMPVPPVVYLVDSVEQQRAVVDHLAASADRAAELQARGAVETGAQAFVLVVDSPEAAIAAHWIIKNLRVDAGRQPVRVIKFRRALTAAVPVTDGEMHEAWQAARAGAGDGRAP